MDNLSKQAKDLITKYGENGYQKAKATIKNDKNLTNPTNQILTYFIEESWPNRQHPALISLACEAVGGDPAATDEVSAALVLLTGAADIHDDIVDKSKTKARKQTAYGKFSQDKVLLAGDILLLKALTMLAEACEKLPPQTRRAIRTLVEDAFVEIGCATTKEREYKGKFDLDPRLSWKTMSAKGAISDAFSRVGATIGGGTSEEISSLGHYGRALGFLMAVRNEFADMLDPVELKNRAKNEVLPLPVLWALQNKSAKPKIMKILERGLTRVAAEEIANLAMATSQVQELKRKMKLKANNDEQTLKSLPKTNGASFKMLLRLSVEGL
jgi:geranylgeranyl pyrophosphate synthase